MIAASQTPETESIERRQAPTLVMPLGALTRAQAEALVRADFGGVELAWFDRAGLRSRPVQTLVELWRRRWCATVLVAPDLAQSRLQLTSFLLCLSRAEAYWRVDANGRSERWTLREHIARNGGSMLRHLLACTAVLVLGHVLLAALAAFTRSRPPIQPPRRRSGRQRILYLRSQLWLGLSGGGSVAHTAGVIGGLQQLGSEVQVVSSDRLAGVEAPVRVVTPEIWFDGWLRELEDLAYNLEFTRAAWRAARHFRPHAMYQRHTAFNVAGAILSHALRIPLVLEYNSSEIWKGHYWGGLRLERVAQLAERINLQAAAHIVVVSRVLRDELVAAGVPTHRILVNPNGVDPAVFRADRGGAEIRARLGIASNVVVGFSGTFGAWHGIPTLAQAVPLVLQARPGVRWLVMGDGPLRPTLDAAVAGDARVVRLGMVPHGLMPGHLAACDILVSPHGRQADGGEFFGSPTKLYEYMAAGRPIVASRLGQIGDVLAHEGTALLVEPDDPRALASAIVRLVDDARLRVRLGCAARRAAEERHTWRQNAQRVLAMVDGA